MHPNMVKDLQGMKETPREEWTERQQLWAEVMLEIKKGRESDDPLEQVAAARRFSRVFGDGDPEHWDMVVGDMKGFIDSFDLVEPSTGLTIADEIDIRRSSQNPETSKGDDGFISQFDEAAKAFRQVREGTEFNNPLPFNPNPPERER